MATSDLGVVKPVNKGAHDSTAAYEILNIVTSNNKTYMANKDVPVSTAITAKEYWLDLSGNALTEAELASVSLSKATVTNKIVTEKEKSVADLKILKNEQNVASVLNGLGNKISAIDYATSTKGGTIKIRVSGGECFITTDGSTP